VRICAFRHGGIVPPVYGALIRSYELLVNLIRRGHEVSLYSYGEGGRNYTYSNIRCRQLGRAAPFASGLGKLLYGVEGEWGFKLLFSGTPNLAAAAREEIRMCDIVYVEHIWSSLFPLMYARIYHKRSVLDNHNVETMLADRSRQEARGFLQRVLAFIWLSYVLLLEKISCSLADLVIVTSETDRELLWNMLHVPVRKIQVVPNGVDLGAFRPSVEEGLRVRSRLGLSENAAVITFVGMLDYPPNLYAVRWIVDELVPKIHRRRPDTFFLIVGRNPPRGLGKDNRIVFAGEVESVVPFINAADICIAPMTVGSGTRMKILSYLSCEKPVVSTELGVEGLDSSVTAKVCVGHLSEFPNLILELLRQPKTPHEIGVREAISRYDWKTVSAKLEGMLISLIEERRTFATS